MNNTTAINWHTFKARLLQHPDHVLQFRYGADKWIDAAYHITEIKQAPITSVDCGGIVNKWTEIILQLWEPSDEHQERAMKAEKALSIIDLVERTLPLDPAATVKIEFGNSRFDTRQLFPSGFEICNGELHINLMPDTVQCKAIERGDSCGSSKSTPTTCTPGGGCC